MKRRRRTSPKLEAWWSSPQFREHCLKQAEKMNAVRRALPRCGAKRKRDGCQCEAPALKNGRCYWHGGRTPKGKQWHVRQFPDGRSPNAEDKLARRVQDRQLSDHRRRLRIANMTPEQRAAYEAWRKAHKPGPSAERQYLRTQRKGASELTKLMAEPPAPPSREQREVARALEIICDEIERRALSKLELFS